MMGKRMNKTLNREREGTDGEQGLRDRRLKIMAFHLVVELGDVS